MVNLQSPDHTKAAFKKHEILTVHGIIVKNALTLMHKIKNMPSLLPKSIVQLFPADIPKYKTSHEDNMDWLAIYNQPYLRSSIFYKGPILAISEDNVSRITCLPSIFSINIYKKSAKRILLDMQNSGTDEEWPPFFLYNLPGLRTSARTVNLQINYNITNSEMED